MQIIDRKIQIVAAVALIDVDGRILISKRPENKYLGGLWEFPGGKLENTERAEDALIRELDEELNIDLSRVYASGYSNGGYLIYGLACRLSNKIAAVGSVAGTMLSSTLNNCAASAPIGVINIHGTADYDVPYNGTTGLKSATDVVNFWKDLNQSEIEEISENNGFNQYDYNDLNGDTYVRHFKIINGGHTWDDNIRYGGKSSSQIIWEFVSLFNLSGIIK